LPVPSVGPRAPLGSTTTQRRKDHGADQQEAHELGFDPRGQHPRAGGDASEYRDTDAFIDEIPAAYKDIDRVMDDAADLVEALRVGQRAST